jgi:hypothetical protein
MLDEWRFPLLGCSHARAQADRDKVKSYSVLAIPFQYPKVFLVEGDGRWAKTGQGSKG